MTVQGSRAVQVVLGEGEPGILRVVLESEGFHVVGQARGESELRRILDATHPTVIVLDAGISATAAIDARTRATGAQIVVVWPDDVRASIADERVTPARALEDLGRAVRRAAERTTGRVDDVVTLPESPTLVTVDRDERPLMVVPDIEDAAPARPRRRARQLLMVAAAWTLALTASAAIGLAVPRTFGLFESEVTPRPSIAPSPDAAPLDPSENGASSPDAPDPDPRVCGRPDGTEVPRSDRGRPDDPGRGCGQGGEKGQGRPEDPGGAGNGNGRGEGGRPEDPSGAGNGNGGNVGNGGGGDTASDDASDADVTDGENGGGEKEKASSDDAASEGSSGSNGQGNGPG
ncbi:MAG TPA: hypothetical protein VFZ75_00975 [Actinomycetota bacterium]|nr:hypothetical protein [Actinomycetota bacterium]